MTADEITTLTDGQTVYEVRTGEAFTVREIQGRVYATRSGSDALRGLNERTRNRWSLTPIEEK